MERLMRLQLALVLGVLLIGGCASRAKRSLTPDEDFVALWNAGRIDDAVNLRAEQLASQRGQQSALFGRIVREGGLTLTQSDRDDIDIIVRPGVAVIAKIYWSPDGYFLANLRAGSYQIQTRGSRWVEEASPVSPVVLAPRAVFNVGTITLRQRTLSSIQRTKVRLNVRRATVGAPAVESSGIRVLADKLDHNRFEAFTGVDGAAEVEIPRVPGRWRATSKEPGYAEVWAFFQVDSNTETVELGRFEITRLKQVAIRWVMPTQSASNRFSAGRTVGGTTVLKSYDRYDSPDGIVRRAFSFATGGLIDVKWTERSDLELIQSGDGEILVEIEPGLRSTSLLEFFPGTFARWLDRSDQAAMCDLGQVALESVEQIPLKQLRSATERGKGLPVIEAHTYALRSFDGKRHVLVHVEKIENQPLERRE